MTPLLSASPRGIEAVREEVAKRIAEGAVAMSGTGGGSCR